MNRILIYFSSIFILFLLSSPEPLKAQDFIRNSSVTGLCYAGSDVKQIYIPPPDDFFRKTGKKGNGSITVTYSGFSNQAITAMEYAVSILETLLPADTKISLSANWENLGTDGILGNSSVTGFVGGWSIDALNPEVYYPVTLAEKIAGENINGKEADIELTINSYINWYFGTDGKPSPVEYDLVTVVIHELCHGIGFFDSMTVEGSEGSYGINTFPVIYDTFLESITGNRLTDTTKFLNPSAGLRAMLTGGQLYFNGPLLRNYTGGNKARIYAPSTWDPGSSISHLDENQTLDPNTLMTPFIAKGEAIHDPGKYTMSILGDLGWINTAIRHTPMRDTEENLSEVTLSATIKSDTTYNRDNVGLVYSFDNFVTSDTIYMVSPNSDSIFSTVLSITSYNTDLQYYFYVQDVFNRIARSPALIRLWKYEVYIGTDTIKPEISHTPADYYLETVDSIGFVANVTDRHGVDTVYVEYMVNDGSPQIIGLSAGVHNDYSAILNAKTLSLNGGDSIRYRIFAVDSALSPNISILPEEGFFTIDVENIELTVQSYATDFTGASADFLNYGFEILQPSGFSGASLNSLHPYESPEDNSKSYNYTALLRYPLKLDESGLLINFREIVLVEPGEPGTVFGSDDFYDYVVVEGSKNFGKSWFALADGYDCSYVKSWENSYNNSIVGMNSTFIPTESMMIKHTIFYKPSDKISAGDTLLLRFRLYSDPFANGWGWIIDDLQINPLVDAVENVMIEPVKIYPNPGKGLINISYEITDYSTRPLRFSVYNSSGVCVVKDHYSEGSGTMIDISSYPSGIYFIVVYRDDGIKAYKYSLIR